MNMNHIERKPMIYSMGITALKVIVIMIIAMKSEYLDYIGNTSLR